MTSIQAKRNLLSQVQDITKVRQVTDVQVALTIVALQDFINTVVATPIVLTIDSRKPAINCRQDGRCQYAIDLGAEDLGHCPANKCRMPR